MSASVAFVNSSAAKYSTDALPGDTWETRRTKQTVRAIARAKTELRITTEELAARCSEFLGDEVKPTTLNGLFAGKRKSLSTAEVEMFAAVVRVSTLDLLYPPGEMVEVEPGRTLPSADALILAMQPESNPAPWPRLADDDRVVSCFEIVRLIDDLQADLATIWTLADEAGGAVPLATKVLAEPGSRALRIADMSGWRAKRLEDRVDAHRRRWDEAGPAVPPAIQVLIDVGAMTDEDDTTYTDRLRMLVDLRRYRIDGETG